MENVLPNSVFHDTEFNGVHVIYEGFLKPEEFKAIGKEAINTMKTQKLSKVLGDTGQIKVMSQENQEWIQNHWFPNAIQSGLKHIAMIVPNNVFGQTSVTATNEEAEKNEMVNLRYFIDKNEAIEWLSVQ